MTAIDEKTKLATQRMVLMALNPKTGAPVLSATAFMNGITGNDGEHLSPLDVAFGLALGAIKFKSHHELSALNNPVDILRRMRADAAAALLIGTLLYKVLKDVQNNDEFHRKLDAAMQDFLIDLDLNTPDKVSERALQAAHEALREALGA